MTRENLHETLARLHHELEGAEPIDAALRADLERALAEIREVVDRARPDGEASPLGERLEEVALRFEQSHPLLAQAIGRVVNALSAMGI
jgi:signal transduction histidine kinase